MRRQRNPNTLRVIVCGGRDFNDKAMLSRVLWYVHERRGIAEVIYGGQRGAEQMANQWAFEMGIKRIEVRAEWSRYRARQGQGSGEGHCSEDKGPRG